MVENKIQRVAVIGAGISGVVSAAHLLAAGKEVTVFERSQAAGGVWLYDKRVPIEAHYPSIKPSNNLRYVQDEREGKERQVLLHAPPGPCYESLTNNVSTPLLRTKLNHWPEGTPNYVNHSVLKDYIQDTSQKAGVDDATIYGALVTDIHKEGQEWHVSWKLLNNEHQTNELVEATQSKLFDAVIIASGHYHTPLVPDIPGLAEAKEKWPSKITHSKSFRNAEGFEEKNVLLIGGGVSSMDIAREISPVCRIIHQSTRNGSFDIPAAALPENASRIGEVAEFKINTSTAGNHLPLTAILKSGEIIHNIDRIVLCTGYQMALPFFPQYNDNSASVTEADDSVLITDGTQVHNLHQDIFYIPDPTLAFVGIPFYTATFTLFEFQAIAVAEFFSGNIKLPSKDELRSEYEAKILARGYRRSFHSLRGEEESYVKILLGWVNNDRSQQGLPPIEGHTSLWVEAKKEQMERLTKLFDGSLRLYNPESSARESSAGVVEATA
ncbi:uncharacterized protein N7483_011773 [Penicillium malachiteum]|uniref:uncharacterized protein n=1 Tax=Penicillium malachiteum TaxID=1324776 RepID=UPI0025477886|nr:uncharacterized protein N7483_011773 [Penicillium malachiteum]KAJ5714592.1 hypothetical protein N7483_011773 [Penicillium malachiteum]